MLHGALSTSLVRRVHFSAGHRYAVPEWSVDKNREVFGSCFSEFGHGHNYIIEAEIAGPIDANTGMIINLRDVDAALKQLVAPLDHHFLNTDIDYFKSHVPTTENLATYCFHELEKLIPNSVQLKRLRVYEGDDLWVDVSAE